MGVAAAMFEDLGWRWLPSHRADPRAAALYRRHYSAEKNARPGKVVRNFMGPGETLVLLTPSCDALFAWQRNIGAPRLDKQDGVCCTVFRNEGPILSSDLIREACEIAWQRWPGHRLFTYVWDAKVKSANPGYCFKKAGWRACGRNADGRLTILDILPPDSVRQRDGQSSSKEAATEPPTTGSADGHGRRQGAGDPTRQPVLSAYPNQDGELAERGTIGAGTRQGRRPATASNENEPACR